MEPRRFPAVPQMCPMRSALAALRRRTPFLVSLAFLAACQDAPVAPSLRPRAASADVSAAAPFVVINTANAGVGSLRQALLDADATPGADVVGFAIPTTDPGCVSGTCTIRLATQLEISSADGVTVDGSGSGIIVSGNDARLVVMFDPRISHAEMQRLLRLSRARIVDGPNDAGAYVLAVQTNGEKAALDALRGEPGVALVQSLDRGEAGDKR